MSLGFWNDLFPPPRYLNLPTFGLDISDRSVKFFQLHGRRAVCRIESFGELAIPLGLIEGGQIKEPAKLAEVLGRLRSEFGLRWVTFALPEELAFVVRLSLPPMAEAELRSSIELQLEEHVPLSPAELVFDYEILAAPPAKGKGGGFEVAVSVFPQAVVSEYVKTLTQAGLEPRACEIEAQAIARSLLPRGSTETFLIVDFGGTRTSFFVVERGRVTFTSTVGQIGGQDVTHSIQRNLNLGAEEAEALKIRRGLLNDKRHEQLAFAVVPTISVLRDELNKVFGYWMDHNPGSAINKIILCGGQSTLPGLMEYLSFQAPVPISLGNVWTRVCDLEHSVPPINFNQSERFASAIGLALRQLEL